MSKAIRSEALLAYSTLKTEMISYNGAKEPVEAFVSRPDTTEPRPGIVVIHDIAGLSDHTKDVANRFAREGYVALAPNLFSSDHELKSLFIPRNVGMALGFMQKIPAAKMSDRSFMEAELSKEPQATRDTISRVIGKMFGGMPKEALVGEAARGVEFLGTRDYVKTGSVGIVGFCFGGGISISTACNTGAAACIVFYGENPSPIEQVERIQCPILGLYGAEDMRINATLDQLTAAMVRYKKDFQMKIYPGAGHAFFNDASSVVYREAAAKDAWELALRFFAQTLKGNQAPAE